jgi:hypothetical protein
VGLDSGLCLQGHTMWVGDFSTFVGVYWDDNKAHDSFFGFKYFTFLVCFFAPHFELGLLLFLYHFL